MDHRSLSRRRILALLSAPLVAGLPRAAQADCPECRIIFGNDWQPPEQPRAAPAPARSTPREVPAAPPQTNGRGVRRLIMANAHNNESIDVVYWRDGSYQEQAMRAIYRFMRDWRDDTSGTISPGVVDFIYRTHRELSTTEPFILVSGFRSRATNAMLIARSRERNGGVSQVASNSLHLIGRANDLRMRGHSVATIAAAARRIRGGGGVGRYTASDFVHLDDGPSRTWGA